MVRRAARPARHAAESLTPRELDVVRAVARGLTNAELAAELSISLSTVKTHLAGAQRKLGVRNRTEIAIWAWRATGSGEGTSGKAAPGNGYGFWR